MSWFSSWRALIILLSSIFWRACTTCFPFWMVKFSFSCFTLHLPMFNELSINVLLIWLRIISKGRSFKPSSKTLFSLNLFCKGLKWVAKLLLTFFIFSTCLDTNCLKKLTISSFYLVSSFIICKNSSNYIFPEWSSSTDPIRSFTSSLLSANPTDKSIYYSSSNPIDPVFFLSRVLKNFFISCL